MKNFIVRVLINALALSAAAWIVDGIQLSADYAGVLVVALIFGVLNAVLKPVLTLLSLPFILISLGLFALVLNGAMLMITARFTDHLSVSGLGSAILGSIVISLVTMVLGRVLDDGDDRGD